MKRCFAQIDANRMYLRVDDPPSEVATTITASAANQAADHLISRQF
jgi:hypothetical protein